MTAQQQQPSLLNPSFDRSSSLLGGATLEENNEGTSFFSSFFSQYREGLCGAVSGSAALAVGYPLDTIKVRMQGGSSVVGRSGIGAGFSYEQVTHHHFLPSPQPVTSCSSSSGSYARCVREILVHDGPRGFFRGISLPLFSGAALSGTRFQAYEKSYDVLFPGQQEAEQRKGGSALAASWRSFVAGGVSGIFSAFISTPVEMVKCRKQLNNAITPTSGSALSNTTSFLSPLRRSSELSFKSFFVGHSATLAREVPGTAAWFGSYEFLIQYCLLPWNRVESKEEISKFQLAVAGGLAGMAYWSAFFPADVVKTRMQTFHTRTAATETLQHQHPGGGSGFYHYNSSSASSSAEFYHNNNNTNPPNFRETFRAVCKEGGLYRGFGVTLLRALPTNMTLFFVYEWSKAWW